MDLEWVVLCSAVVEGLMLILITLPGPKAFKRGLAFITTNLLKIFFSVYCLLLLMDIYSKYDETMPTCESHTCSTSEHLRHETSIMKSQRDALLVATVLVFYWILYPITKLVVCVDQLKQRTEKLKNQVQ